LDGESARFNEGRFETLKRAPDKEVTIIAVKDGQFVPIGNRKPSAE
jgi:hypothetical protein